MKNKVSRRTFSSASLLTVGYLEMRGRRADVRAFDRILARVRDVPPAVGDELPAQQPVRRKRQASRKSKASRD